MERESNPMETLCRSGCGFYGNPSTDGLCSVCFKEALKKKQQPPASSPSPVSAPFVATPSTPLAAAAPTVPSLPAQPQTHTDVRPHLSYYPLFTPHASLFHSRFLVSNRLSQNIHKDINFTLFITSKNF
ncbi:hypothetical protein HF086_014265 [Spodoptera exigua]|uniref:A20-type domain-containing protein n=1 Tax=Spodoptera exigua TaxID=7107 RepID=A0A922M723_SPOEX|nr:hypothetical protein HF086_014265 [Spodoptera exigua]